MGIINVIPGKEHLAHKWLDSILERQNTMYGCLCFSDTFKESVLWSHYADKHRGIALEVRFDYDPIRIIQMRYPPERPTIDASIYTELSNDDVELSKYMLPRIELMIRQKSPGWALTPSFINGDEAEYYFQQTINGRVLTFKVEFVKENGVWKIFEF